MERAAFARVLAAGLGRALRDARTVPADVRRECLLEACSSHQALDPQLSGNRGRWLGRVLEASGDLDVLAPGILRIFEELPDTDETHDDADQLVELAAVFARRSIPVRELEALGPVPADPPLPCP